MPPRSKTNRVDDGQREHDEYLATQKSAQDIVGITREPIHGFALTGRHECAKVCDDRIPVTQQVKGQDRNQEQAYDSRRERPARLRDRHQDLCTPAACYFAVARKKRTDADVGAGFNVEIVRDARQPDLLDLSGDVRQCGKQRGDLRADQGAEQQDEQPQEQKRQHEYRDNSQRARQAQALQPIR